MSDFHQDLVAPDVPEDVAGAQAAKIVAWLQHQGVIAASPSNCVMHPDVQGYAPGPGWQTVAENVDGFLSLGVNGVEVVTARTVFDTGGNGIEVKCASCNEIFKPDDAYIEAIDAWWNGDDKAVYVCARCGHEARLVDWTGPWAFGFGCLGLQFWNWPPLRPQFVEQVARVLGSRVVVVRCHM